MPTLIDMINTQFGVPSTPASSGKTKVASATSAVPNYEDLGLEKLASMCDYVAQMGVENVVKTAGAHDPSTNAGAKYAPRTHVYATPTKLNPSKDPKGEPKTNMSASNANGGGAYARSGGGAKHPALKSNASAMGVKPSDHSKHVSSDLKALLASTPFADPIPKHDLAHASKAGEPNIHSGKAKTASDKKLLQEAIAYKLAQKQNGEA